MSTANENDAVQAAAYAYALSVKEETLARDGVWTVQALTDAFVAGHAMAPSKSAESGEREEVGDLTTPMEPNALYLTEADVVTFLAKDVVTVARRVGERFDVLLSMDRSEIVGFQINDAATFGQYLMSLKPAPKPLEKPRG